MGKDKCVLCKDVIDEFNENELYRINNKLYCSLNCFYKHDKVKSDESRITSKEVKKKSKKKSKK